MMVLFYCDGHSRVVLISCEQLHDKRFTSWTEAVVGPWYHAELQGSETTPRRSYTESFINSSICALRQ